MISSPFIAGGFYFRQVNGVSCLWRNISAMSGPFKGAEVIFFYSLLKLLPKAIRPAPKMTRFSGSDNMFTGRVPLPIKSAKAPELSKGKTTRTKIKVTNTAVLFTVHNPAMYKKDLFSICNAFSRQLL